MAPWKNAFISGWMLDPKGKKMSKSKGNVIEPRAMIEKYSADALRFMSAGCKLGDDFPFQEKDLLTGNKFVNKIWNASKFGIMHLEDYQPYGKVEKLEVFDKWLLSKLHKVIKISAESFDKFEYSKSKSEVEKFFWQIFCDQYLEIVKDRLYNPDVRGSLERTSGQLGVFEAINSVLKMMSPITPHITEEIYRLYFAEKENEKSVHTSTWPKFDSSLIDEQAELAGDLGVDIINAVRKYKSEKQMSLKEELAGLVLVSSEENFEEMINSISEDLKAVLKVKEIKFSGETSLESEKFAVKVGISA
jgi:valyl-tRNA synthetase